MKCFQDINLTIKEKFYEKRNEELDTDIIMSEIEKIINNAFLLIFKRIIKDISETNNLLISNISGINGLKYQIDLKENSNDYFEKILAILSEKNQKLLICFDELQLFKSKFTIKPQKIQYSDLNDLTIFGFFNCLKQYVVSGHKNNLVWFSTCGTFEALFKVISSSPCHNHPVMQSILPLRNFKIQDLIQIFNHYWKFNITNDTLKNILSKLIGPQKIFQVILLSKLFSIS